MAVSRDKTAPSRESKSGPRATTAPAFAAEARASLITLGLRYFLIRPGNSSHEPWTSGPSSLPDHILRPLCACFIHQGMSKAKDTTLHPRPHPRPQRRRVNWRLAEAKLRLTLPHPGGHGGEAALVMDRGRHCDRNRGGTEQDEFYHGEISIFEPSIASNIHANHRGALNVPKIQPPHKGSGA